MIEILRISRIILVQLPIQSLFFIRNHEFYTDQCRFSMTKTIKLEHHSANTLMYLEQKNYLTCHESYAAFTKKIGVVICDAKYCGKKHCKIVQKSEESVKSNRELQK
ncbi:hypothetical protein V8G54_014647 [Vigna mungo]|uniref:Uncharacterized protein n=1 Tax=Vigna mungo TaxID=3915 RepID=A0AAQ3NKE6_VIGMU